MQEIEGIASDSIQEKHLMRGPMTGQTGNFVCKVWLPGGLWADGEKFISMKQLYLERI